MIRTDLGIATAYAEAVSKGYTGTRDEFGRMFADFGKAAEKVTEDKKAVEQMKASVEETKNSVDTTASEFGQNVADKTAEAIAAITEHANTEKELATAAISEAKDAATGAITEAQTSATDAIASSKDSATAEITKKGTDTLATIPEDYAALTKDVSSLKEDTAALQKRQNVLVGSETGNPIAVDDAFAAPLCGLTVYGKSTQDGTPTPEAPVPIVSAGDGGSVAVKVTGKNLFYEQGFRKYFINSVPDTVGEADGNVSSVLQVVTGAKYYVTRNKIGTKFRVAVVDKLPTKGSNVRPSSAINADSKRQVEIFATSKYMVIQCEDEASFSELMVSLDSSTTYSPYREQILTIPTPNGLPGIPVTSGGNYIDPQGQQWVCDEIDLERGVKVQRITTIVFSDNNNFALRSTNNSTKHRFSIVTDGLKKADLTTADSRAFCSALALGSKDSTWSIPNTFTIGTDGIGANVQLYVRFENINSLDELQQYLQRTPMSLTAILVTPIETPLTPAEIAAYKAITAYAPDTVVQASDGAGVKLEYQRDVNIVIKKFEDAIASMTTT